MPSTPPGDPPSEDRPPADRPPPPSSPLPDYKRPTMPFEREADIGPGAAAWSAIGIEFAIYVVLFFLGGKWLDGKFGWEPWGTSLGGLLGACVGMYMLIRRATRLSR